ncbi:hypothetical protein [Clostridium beijerinckii]|uniref:hypothetical protein n=1 Tax=Clostridium beijerinckii TaxID=1520 RepID=UPI0003D3345A|nr:hypothetical protein [Clostridium beijerinckii]ALB44133.1 hypothetical protein X276_02025 [Clostridium beijerinckii NRRL B-598]MBE6089749.1 hypothetical protein [Clostridium beijerinckii]
MLTCFYKNVKLLYNNYYTIYDIKGKIIKFSFGILFLFLLISIYNPAPMEYMSLLSQKYKLVSVDNIYDYTIPMISCCIIAYAFYNDYKDNTHELITFFSGHKFNYILFCRWFLYTGIFLVGSFITALMYYRTVYFGGVQGILLALRSTPNIIFLTSAILLITTGTKSIYAGIFITTAYTICDYLSFGELFKILSIGANSYNFYYIISPGYYIANRLLILSIGIVNIYIAGRISSN